MFWPKCKTEYVEGFFNCADFKIALVEELPKDSESPVAQTKCRRVKKRPVIGLITVVLSSPVIAWILISVFSKKNCFLDAPMGFLFFFQGAGIIGGILLCSGRIYGNYLTIAAWVYYGCFEIIRWFQWWIAYHESSVVIDHTVPSFRLFRTLLFIPLGSLFVLILYKDLSK